MDPAFLLGATAAKLSSVTPVGTIIMTIGAVFGVAGWIWLIYQNSRFGIVHGVLSAIIPPYALVFAFVGLEHRYKSPFTAAFVGGAVVAGLGYSLLFSAMACESDPDCGLRRDYSGDTEVEGTEEPAEAEETGESSAVFIEECGISA